MYRQVIDRFALNQLIKNPIIPDFHLMVGSAEILDSLPLLVYEHASIPSEIAGNMKITEEKTNEEIEQMISNNELEVNDLNWNLALLGSGLGV